MEIDTRRLRLLADLDTDAGRAAVDALLRGYARDTRTGLAELRDRVQAGDRPAIRRLAHRLKGSSGMVGASGLATLFAAVETTAIDPAADTRDTMLQAIGSAERAFESAVAEILAWLGDAV